MPELIALRGEKLDIGCEIPKERLQSFLFDVLHDTRTYINIRSKVEEIPPATPSLIEVGCFFDDRLRLLRSIVVNIMKEGDSYIAYSNKFEEYGYGDNAVDALDDLRQSISELYWTLKKEQKRLGPAMVKLWNTLLLDIEER